MTRFQQFLMERRLAEYVEYLNTLSESEIQDQLESLDQQTYELVETYINKGKLARFLGTAALGAGLALGAGKLMNKAPGSAPSPEQRTSATAPSDGERVIERDGKLIIPGKKDPGKLVIPGTKKPERKPGHVYDDGTTLYIPK